jgi:two-component system, LuxR family, response regulator FixJ
MPYRKQRDRQTTMRTEGQTAVSVRERTGPMPPKCTAKGIHSRHIFVLDGDEPTLQAVSAILETEQHTVRSFTNPHVCLDTVAQQYCDLLLSGMVTSGMECMEFIATIKRLKPQLPVVVYARSGKIHHAVTAIRSGASDFIEDPLDRATVINRVAGVLHEVEPSYERMPDTLTPSQKAVLGLILRGHTNTQIAGILGKSVRTIEDHRSHTMRRLAVDDVVGLVKLCVAMGVIRV